MKKITKLSTFIAAASIMLVMAGCAKNYTSVQDWFDNNPAAAKLTEAMVADQSDETGTMEFEVQNNDLIYKYTFTEQTFGLDDEMDKLYKETFDASFSSESASQEQIIADIAEDCGIEAASIRLVYEFYNPGSSTPSYTYSYPNN